MNASQKNNREGTLLTYKEIAEDANISLGTAKRLARESGSVLQIGPRIVRVDKEKFYAYLRETYTVNSGD